MSAPAFVIAGNYEQAVRWARENGVSPRDLVYLSDVSDVAGRAVGGRSDVFVCVGTWMDKPAWLLNQMFALLASREFRRVDESEWRAPENG